VEAYLISRSGIGKKGRHWLLYRDDRKEALGELEVKLMQGVAMTRASGKEMDMWCLRLRKRKSGSGQLQLLHWLGALRT